MNRKSSLAAALLMVAAASIVGCSGPEERTIKSADAKAKLVAQKIQAGMLKDFGERGIAMKSVVVSAGVNGITKTSLIDKPYVATGKVWIDCESSPDKAGLVWSVSQRFGFRIVFDNRGEPLDLSFDGEGETFVMCQRDGKPIALGEAEDSAAKKYFALGAGNRWAAYTAMDTMCEGWKK